MATRKYHHKTKLGCLTCKQRRVKCDEGQPYCMNCTKRGHVCTYTSLDAAEEGSIPSQVELTYSANDLQLIQYYCTRVSLSSSPGMPYNFALLTLPRLAFEHEFLMRILLGLVAMHQIHSQTAEDMHAWRIPASAEYLTAEAARHVNMALPLYKQAFQSVNQGNCAALMLSSGLLSAYVLGTSRTGLNPFRQRSGTNALAIDIVDWLRLIVGGAVAVRPWIPYIMTTEVGEGLPSELWTQSRSPSTSPQIERDLRLANLQMLWAAEGPGRQKEGNQASLDLSERDRNALSEALCRLREAYVWAPFKDEYAVEHGPGASLSGSTGAGNSGVASAPSASIPLPNTLPQGLSDAITPYSAPCAVRQGIGASMAFLHNLGEEFLSLLTRRHPFSLVLMGHFAALLRHRGVWWMKGVGEDMMSWVAQELRDSGQIEWISEIEWPMKHLEGSGHDNAL